MVGVSADDSLVYERLNGYIDHYIHLKVESTASASHFLVLMQFISWFYLIKRQKIKEKKMYPVHSNGATPTPEKLPVIKMFSDKLPKMYLLIVLLILLIC